MLALKYAYGLEKGTKDVIGMETKAVASEERKTLLVQRQETLFSVSGESKPVSPQLLVEAGKNICV